MNEEKILKTIEDQKITTWKNNYIDYNLLKNELDSIIENNQKETIIAVENEGITEVVPEFEVLRKSKDDDNDDISLGHESLKPPSKKRLDNMKIVERATINKSKKDFVKILDEQFKNFYKFYKIKEKHLFENINLQIKKEANSINDNEKMMEIIVELKYLSNLCKELLNFVYYNITVLVLILNRFDQKYENISYNYIKQYLSKNNGELADIIKFKVIDESLVAIKKIFDSIKRRLNQNNYFNQKTAEEKDKFKNDEKDIFDNINKSNDIHEKIFVKLNDWKKYLNRSLELPTSSHNSIFRDTSFVGDEILISGDEIQQRNSKQRSSNNNNIYLNDPDDNNSLLTSSVVKLEDYGNSNNLKEELLIYKILSDPLDIYSISTEKKLSKYNNHNIMFILSFIIFYSYSYIILVPHIVCFLNENNEDINIIYLYSIAISIPIIGNIIGKCVCEKKVKNSYKSMLITSLIFVIIYYICLILGIIFYFHIPKKKFSFNYEQKIQYTIIIIIIGRLFLGLSNLKQLAKLYIDIYIPLNYQVQVNTKYNKSIYIGYILGLLINIVFCFKSEINYYAVMGFSALLCFIILFCFIFKYKDQKQINELNDNESRNNNEPEMQRAETDDEIIQFEIKTESIENIEKDEDNNEDLLTNLKDEQKNSLLKYYKLILIIVLFILFSNQYISENLLLFLPLLIAYDIKSFYFIENSNIIIYSIISSLIFCLSLFLQRIYLRKSHFQKNIKIILIILSFLLIIFSLCFLSLGIEKLQFFNSDNSFTKYIIAFSFFIIILLNELYRVITINLFIRLLPSNKIGNLKASILINIVSKIGRIAPSLIIMIYYSFQKKETILLSFDTNTIYIGKTIIYGLQSLFMLINLILLLCFFSYIKNRSINRILNL